MTGILNGKLASSYLKTARGQRSTRISFLATKQERDLIEQASKSEGVSLAETARRLTYKGLKG